MIAAKIVRDVASKACIVESRGGDMAWTVYCNELPEGDVDEALHAAADALDALAVPGVASLLAHLAISLSMQTDTGSRVGSKWMLSDEERASLAALAKIARGE